MRIKLLIVVLIVGTFFPQTINNKRDTPLRVQSSSVTKKTYVKEATQTPIPTPSVETPVVKQTPLPTPEPTPIPVPTHTPAVSNSTGSRSGCGDNEFAAFIYGNESGGKVPGKCNTTVQNAEGCIGIGQACPASKLIAVCPNLDYECENVFFTNYANSRYGGWAGAYQWWLSHKWW